MSKKHPEISVAKFNVRSDREISKKHKIGKLPGMVLLVDGEMYPVPNPRKARSVTDFINFAATDYEAVVQAEKDRVVEEKRKLDEMEAKSNVVKLDYYQMETRAHEQGVWLIEYYGEKFGYCKNLSPTWEALADYVKENKVPITIAKAVSKNVPTFSRQAQANPWPAIKLYRDGQIYTFPSPRELREDVKEYVDYALEGYKGTDSIEINKEQMHAPPKPRNMDQLPNPALELTPEHFSNGTLSEGIWLVDFYSPTCGFCKM